MAKSIWQKKSHEEIKARVLSALDRNVSYIDKSVLGVPGSHLDSKVFNKDADFLDDAPFLRSLLENPNHIGCHTLASSEPFFGGTQEIERELLNICAVDILGAELDGYDGYVASGGTEANIQAIWIYRNYFLKALNAKQNEIAIICSSDSHYSVDKAANLLSLDISKIDVQNEDRSISPTLLEKLISEQKKAGKSYFIFVCNMMTTMFGSVDDIEMISSVLRAADVEFKLHVDAAYGGFYYPFSNKNSPYNFVNPQIGSFALDAHKMVQSPYGTGVFLIRKEFIKYTSIHDAKYVKGEECTLVGSRSGANAISVWMILVSHGRAGWRKKVERLQSNTKLLTNELDRLNVTYIRDPYSNIVTIENKFVSQKISKKYFLVPDDHTSPSWQKIVVMEHVTPEQIQQFTDDLSASLNA